METIETYQRALEHTLATGERSEFEVQAALPNGNVRTGLCFIAAERAADGRISGAIAVARDITERKRNEAELERHRQHLEKLVEDRTHALSIAKETAEAATRAKSQFLAAASHDLRQPLQAIRLFNDALGMTDLEEKQKRISRNLSKSVNSLSELLNQLLDISRLDAGTIKPQPAAIQAEDLLGIIGSRVRCRFPGEEPEPQSLLPAGRSGIVQRREFAPDPVAQPRRQCREIHGARRSSGGHPAAGRSRTDPGMGHGHRNCLRADGLDIRGILPGRQSGTGSSQGRWLGFGHRQAAEQVARHRGARSLACGQRLRIRTQCAAGQRIERACPRDTASATPEIVAKARLAASGSWSSKMM